MVAKRKFEDDDGGSPNKKIKDNSGTVSTKFRAGLFEDTEFEKNKSSYAKSQPYKHGIISSLIADDLLRRVRTEIIEQIHFTEKETDIYKIHQSGDLANLDGLDNDSLKQLPSLLELRNAMYSSQFREYVSGIADAGPLSGKKTDMAINVYTPGSHLLCHDDVIGSRRVSYILYLTDPDKPWQAEWGGALRLYPTQLVDDAQGTKLKTPAPDFTVSIPPAWNQMSFFAVQPGESFHDVEEVFHSGNSESDKGRVRMAISGWYHIPQKGEEGYVEGAEEELATSSSLTQLQTKDVFDIPRTEPTTYPEYSQPISKSASKKAEDPDHETLTQVEIEYLLRFIAPNLLTPDGVTGLREAFQDASCIRVDNFLSKKFAQALKAEVENQPASYDGNTSEIESSSSWTVARPPHKHRYLFMLPSVKTEEKVKGQKEETLSGHLEQLLSVYMTSLEFRKWLRLATGLVLKSHDLKARRFRKGADYQLATSYDEENPRLELTLGMTPEGQWETEEAEEAKQGTNSKARPEEINNGGYEVWMAPDDEDGEDGDDVTNAAVPNTTSNGTGVTGAHAISNKDKSKATSDPAIYKSSTAAEDDGILFSMAAGWNRLSLVLRDSGTHRFVKYISRAAGADRWDVIGDFEVDWDATPDFEDEEDQGDDQVQNDTEEDDDTVRAEDDEDEDEDEDSDDNADEQYEKIRMSFNA